MFSFPFFCCVNLKNYLLVSSLSVFPGFYHFPHFYLSVFLPLNFPLSQVQKSHGIQHSVFIFIYLWNNKQIKMFDFLDRLCMSWSMEDRDYLFYSKQYLGTWRQIWFMEPKPKMSHLIAISFCAVDNWKVNNYDPRNNENNSSNPRLDFWILEALQLLESYRNRSLFHFRAPSLITEYFEDIKDTKQRTCQGLGSVKIYVSRLYDRSRYPVYPPRVILLFDTYIDTERIALAAFQGNMDVSQAYDSVQIYKDGIVLVYP